MKPARGQPDTSVENPDRTRQSSSPLLGAPFFLRALETSHDGVTLRLLDVAPATPRPAGILDALSTEERARAARFRSVEDRSRFGLTRAALRHLLGEATGLAPEALVFVTGPWGKPCLAGAEGPYFNVSHSGSLALIGLSRLRPIGVDIEATRDISDLLGLAEACFSPREYRALVALPPGERERTFLAIWTGKEAVLKALGTGIADGLRDFSVALDHDDLGSNRSKIINVIDSKDLERGSTFPHPALAGERYSVIAETPGFARRLVGVALERITVPDTYAAAFALA